MKNYLYSLLALLLCCVSAQAAVSFDAAKQYSIKNVESGLYLSIQASSAYTENGSTNATPLVASANYFNIEANSTATKYAFKSGDLYMALSSSSSFSGWNTKSQTTTSQIWTIEEGPASGQYYIKSTKGYLYYDGKNKYAFTNGQKNSKAVWIIDEKIPFATEIEDGKCYRFTCQSYPDRMLTEVYTDGGKLSGLTSAQAKSPYSQVWKLTKSAALSGTEGKYKLTNVMTGKSIATQASTSQQFKTGTAADFVVQKGLNGDDTYFTFGLAKDGAGLHCANTQGYNVVNWSVSAEASHWYLQQIELTPEQLAEMEQQYREYTEGAEAVSLISKNRTTYNTKLLEFFTDPSCSELKDEYKSKTDDELLALLADLPDPVKQMALRVKSGIWESGKDAKYNQYVHDFRINTYEAYSDRQEWRKITNVGPFGQLVNPTGITVKAGDIVYVYLDQTAKTGATIKMELAKGTEHTGQLISISKGINAIQASEDGELFVYYFVTNTKKPLSDYPDIRVHIEGGHATGTWDMHRGMTEADWTYLAKNMFGAEYLHVKGESTVLSLVTSKVKAATKVEGIVKIWDFIFQTQERLIGHDGQWDGYYRPVITPRDCNVSMNPNWGGNCGTNHPSIDTGYLFNFEKMVNDPGHNWEIYHEIAHAHQYPINLAATTESSNNGYAQMTNYEFGSYNSRNKGIETLVIFKNNDWGWVDILRGGEGCSRSEGFQYYDDALWLQCHMFFQLYQYFHIQGYMPDFWPRVADAMRSNGGITYGRSATSPGYYYNDYLKFAKVCAEVSQTDLWEFFDTWGFFSYCDEVKVGNDYKKENAQYFKNNDRPDLGVRFVGDYGSYYLRMPIRGNAADEKYLADLKTEMQAYKKKAPGIMFIDDHIKQMKVTDTCFVATIYPSRVGTDVKYYGVTKGTSGDFGMFWEFDGVTGAKDVYYTMVGNAVTMHGSGFVGIKIYDQENNIVRIYNTMKFTLDKEIAAGLLDGTYRMEAPLGNNTQIVVPKDAPDPTEGISPVIKAAAESGEVYDLFGRSISAPRSGDILIHNGKKVLVK